MYKDLVTAIDCDHVSVTITIHIGKDLKVPKVTELTHANVHFVEALGRRDFEELCAKCSHVEELLTTSLHMRGVTITEVEVFLLTLMLFQLLLVLLLIDSRLFGG